MSTEARCSRCVHHNGKGGWCPTGQRLGGGGYRRTCTFFELEPHPAPKPSEPKPPRTERRPERMLKRKPKRPTWKREPAKSPGATLRKRHSAAPRRAPKLPKPITSPLALLVRIWKAGFNVRLIEPDTLDVFIPYAGRQDCARWRFWQSAVNLRRSEMVRLLRMYGGMVRPLPFHGNVVSESTPARLWDGTKWLDIPRPRCVGRHRVGTLH